MKKGFTIVEASISALVLAVIIIGVYNVLNIGSGIYSQDTDMLDLQQQARQAVDRMSREIRQAQASTVSVPRTDTINFQIYGEPDQITYYYNASSSRVMRRQGTNTTILGNFISSLSFYLSGQALQIQIRATKIVGRRIVLFPATGVLVHRVKLRN